MSLGYLWLYSCFFYFLSSPPFIPYYRVSEQPLRRARNLRRVRQLILAQEQEGSGEVKRRGRGSSNIGVKRGARMDKRLDNEKERLKAQIAAEIDSYYQDICDSLEAGRMKIDRIEQKLVEKKARLNELVNSATGQAYSEARQSTEKNDVPYVVET